jgi:hypothetical protein
LFILLADLNKHVPEHREEVRVADVTLVHISAWKLMGVMLKFAILTCRKTYCTQDLGILLYSQVHRLSLLLHQNVGLFIASISYHSKCIYKQFESNFPEVFRCLIIIWYNVFAQTMVVSTSCIRVMASHVIITSPLGGCSGHDILATAIYG